VAEVMFLESACSSHCSLEALNDCRVHDIDMAVLTTTHHIYLATSWYDCIQTIKCRF